MLTNAKRIKSKHLGRNHRLDFVFSKLMDEKKNKIILKSWKIFCRIIDLKMYKRSVNREQASEKEREKKKNERRYTDRLKHPTNVEKMCVSKHC